MSNTRKAITKVIKELGIPANLSGYHYIRYAIEITLDDFNLVNRITKLLYPAVAKKFNTTKTGAERAIRHAIEVGWLNANEDFVMELFGYSISADKGKPTNSEFIATVADYISLTEVMECQNENG